MQGSLVEIADALTDLVFTGFYWSVLEDVPVETDKLDIAYSLSLSGESYTLKTLIGRLNLVMPDTKRYHCPTDQPPIRL